MYKILHVYCLNMHFFFTESNFFTHLENELLASSCSDGDVRLINGFTQYEGTVEVCLNHVWGSVCRSTNYYNYWGMQEGRVVCGQLGYQRLGKILDECIQVL